MGVFMPTGRISRELTRDERISSHRQGSGISPAITQKERIGGDADYSGRVCMESEGSRRARKREILGSDKS